MATCVPGVDGLGDLASIRRQWRKFNETRGMGEIITAYEKAVGRHVAPSIVYRMLKRHDWRKIMPRPRHPKNDPVQFEMFKKKLIRAVAKQVTRAASHGRPLRLMFEDEGRFGRINDPQRCWACLPCRPHVSAQRVREYIYAYAAVSPHDGVLDSLILPTSNADMMSLFLAEVSARHINEEIFMVVDGASWHRANELIVPSNMNLLPLPPYCPELNPVEHIWDEIREKWFPNVMC